jgi:hypothetical protein
MERRITRNPLHDYVYHPVYTTGTVSPSATQLLTIIPNAKGARGNDEA